MTLTDITLPEEVALAFSDIITGKLPVDLVLDIGHGDERGHDARPAASLDCAHRPEIKRGASSTSAIYIPKDEVRTPGGDRPVVDVARGREAGAAVVLGERHGHLARGRVEDRALVDDPVVLGRVPVEVRRVRQDAREVRERVLRDSSRKGADVSTSPI